MYDADAVPEGLGTGYPERREDSGSLTIKLGERPFMELRIGKVKNPLRNERDFFITIYNGSIIRNRTEWFEHLILAITRVHEIIEQFETTGMLPRKED